MPDGRVRHVSGCDLMVTGAAGFVGGHVLTRAQAQGLAVSAIEGDVRERDSVAEQLSAAQPRAVIHLASPVRTSASQTDELLADELAMAESLLSAVLAHVPDAVVLIA